MPSIHFIISVPDSPHQPDASLHRRARVQYSKRFLRTAIEPSTSLRFELIRTLELAPHCGNASVFCEPKYSTSEMTTAFSTSSQFIPVTVHPQRAYSTCRNPARKPCHVPSSPPARSVRCCSGNGTVGSTRSRHGNSIRIAVPSKGDMHKLTRELLDDVGLSVVLQNPRQYEASVRGLDLQVWLQRPVDIVRKVCSGDVDLGFVGTDLISEYATDADAIVTVHDDLEFGRCRLAVGVPTAWETVKSMDDLRARANTGGHDVLRVATKFHNETARFFRKHNIPDGSYRIVEMDGALEASTSMGTADCIVDLVSSGTTLRENLLKEISGGTVLQSSMQLVGNRNYLAEKSEFGSRLRQLTRELLERIDAYLIGRNNYNIIANIRGSSMVDVSRKLSSQTDLRGVDGPTVSPVVPPADSDEGMYAISIVLPKHKLYSAVQQLRKVGGSGVTVLPVQYVFPEECVRWQRLLMNLKIRQEEEESANNEVTLQRVA